MSGFVIKEMWAFLAIDGADGDEGVPAFEAQGVMMPLVAADQARLDSLRDIARELAKATNTRLTLARFSVREDIEVIEP